MLHQPRVDNFSFGSGLMHSRFEGCFLLFIDHCQPAKYLNKQKGGNLVKSQKLKSWHPLVVVYNVSTNRICLLLLLLLPSIPDAKSQEMTFRPFRPSPHLYVNILLSLLTYMSYLALTLSACLCLTPLTWLLLSYPFIVIKVCNTSIRSFKIGCQAHIHEII